MNLFTTGPAVFKLGLTIKKYYNHIPEFEACRKAGDDAKEKELIGIYQTDFANEAIKKLETTINITGEENIPTDHNFMVYANHQSMMDVPALCYAFRNHQLGFVSKKEWEKWPIMGKAISYTRSIYLDRGNPREAIKVLKEAVDYLKRGFNIAIFPEGTRSRSGIMGEFKHGTLKFAQKGKVPIIPVTLDGGYKVFEEKGSIQKATVNITIHPEVHIENMAKKEQESAFEEIEAQIKSALSEPQPEIVTTSPEE